MNDSEEHRTGSGAGSVKKCHPVVPGPVTRLWETPSLSSPLHFNWHPPYLLLFRSTPCKHTQTYTTAVISAPFKNPLYCKSCSAQSCWRPVWIFLSWDRVLLKWESNIFWRTVIMSAGVGPTEKEAALWSWTIQTKTACSHITECQQFLLLLYICLLPAAKWRWCWQHYLLLDVWRVALSLASGASILRIERGRKVQLWLFAKMSRPFSRRTHLAVHIPTPITAIFFVETEGRTGRAPKLITKWIEQGDVD